MSMDEQCGGPEIKRYFRTNIRIHKYCHLYHVAAYPSHEMPLILRQTE